MDDQPKDEKNWNKIYWLVFGIGILFILLLGLFTYLFNNPTV